MRIFDGKTYRDMTEEEVKEIKKQERLFMLEEKRRPMTTEEVNNMLIAKQVNTLVVDDATALRMKYFYPQWEAGTAYTADFKVQRIGRLWKCLQPHTSQAGWEPGATGTESLWTEINETYDGTEDDPIPYNNNMALESGKYYIQDNVVYLCTRDTGNPVYNPLASLVGLYVEID